MFQYLHGHAQLVLTTIFLLLFSIDINRLENINVIKYGNMLLC